MRWERHLAPVFLQAKFRNLKLPSETRCAEILRLFERKCLVRLENTAGPFAEAIVRVLPTIRFVIPFQDIEDWNRTRDRHTGSEPTVDAAEEVDEPAE